MKKYMLLALSMILGAASVVRAEDISALTRFIKNYSADVKSNDTTHVITITTKKMATNPAFSKDYTDLSKEKTYITAVTKKEVPHTDRYDKTKKLIGGMKAYTVTITLTPEAYMQYKTAPNM